MHKITDFEVGQRVALEVVGNEARRIKAGEAPIREAVVEKVGKKYVTVQGRQFFEHPAYMGLREKTDSCVNFVLYPNKKVLEEKLEKDSTLSKIREFCNYSGKLETLTLAQAKNVLEILNQGGNE